MPVQLHDFPFNIGILEDFGIESQFQHQSQTGWRQYHFARQRIGFRLEAGHRAHLCQKRHGAHAIGDGEHHQSNPNRGDMPLQFHGSVRNQSTPKQCTIGAVNFDSRLE